MISERCAQGELACAYAAGALPAEEKLAAERHVAECAQCRRELESVRPALDRLGSPSASLQMRLAERIAAQAGGERVLPPCHRWAEPDWESVAPGIECKLLASDEERSRVSMLVRLVPGGQYPAHTHADVEELHLLEGELWIDDRKLYPGDYNRAVPGTGDSRVWSETGCVCVLITSTRDLLR